MFNQRDDFKLGLIAVLGLIAFLTLFWVLESKLKTSSLSQSGVVSSASPPLPTVTSTPVPPTPTPLAAPDAFQLNGGSHSFQTFNNCGPASLSMALSFYGIAATQQELGTRLRPYQIASGDNDDKSVTLAELAKQAPQFGLTAFHRPNGDIATLQTFISQGIPVITRTLLTPADDIGHYRVVYGYDARNQTLLQNDSLQGQGLTFSNEEFLSLWRPFGYEYLVLVPPDKVAVAQQILGPDLDEDHAWRTAITRLNQELERNPQDVSLKFARAVAYYHIGEYEQSVAEFETIESQLPFRTLWYQIEPLLAYSQLKKYDELLPRIEAILAGGNRAFSELYFLRGQYYLEQGQTAAARQEFELARRYNSSFKPAQAALENLN